MFRDLPSHYPRTSEGVIHYCVPNMPSVVARTATHAYLTAAFPYIMELISHGIDSAIQTNPAIERGVATYKGEARHISSFSSLAQME